MLEAALWAHIPPQPPTHIHTDAMVVVIVKGYKKGRKKLIEVDVKSSFT